MTDVQLAKDGDAEAFARLISRYKNAATSVALGYLRNVAWSEDVAQDAFLQAWRALPTLRQPESFGPWLLQLVRRNALQALRLGKRAEAREKAWEKSRAPDDGHAEAEALVLRALDEVPDDAREVLILYYREGQSTRQVAELLSLSEPAVRKRLERARAALREEFGALAKAAEKTAAGAAFVVGLVLLLPSTSQAAALSAVVTANTVKIGAGAAALFTAIFFARMYFVPKAHTPIATPSFSQKSQPHGIFSFSLPPNAPLSNAAMVSAADDNESKDALAEDTRPRLRVEGTLQGGSGGGMVLFSADEAIIRAHSDAGGAFVAEVPAGVYHVTAVRSALAGALLQPLAISAATHGVHIAMAAGAAVDGVMRADKGGAVSGVSAVLSPSFKAGDVARALGNAAGEFHFANVPPGNYDIEITAPGYARHVVQSAVLLAGDDFVVDETMRALTPTQGHLQNADGQPLANTTVNIRAMSLPDEKNFADAEVVSDAAGNFSASLFAGRYDVSVGAPFFWAAEIEPGGTLQLIVPSNGTIAGTIPLGLADAGINAMQQIESTFGTSSGKLRETQADAAGNFSITVPAGKYFVVAEKDGHNVAEQALQKFVEVKPGQTATVSLVANAPNVRITVTSDGAPVSGAMLSTRPGHFTMLTNGNTFDVQQPLPFTAYISKDGRTGSVEVMKPGDVTVDLQPGGRINGTVAGADNDFSVSIECDVCDYNERHFVGPNFVWDSAPAGTVHLNVTTSDGTTGLATIEVPAGGEVAATVTVAASATISGTVHFLGAPPTAPTLVSIRNARAVGTEVSLVDGKFTIKGIAAGEHVLRALMLGGNFAERKFTVVVGENLDVGVIDIPD